MDELIEDIKQAIRRDDGNNCIALQKAGCADPDGCVCLSLARAALAAIHARGDRVVPGVATAEMEMRGMGAFPDDLAGTWKWMLSASPYAPEGT